MITTPETNLEIIPNSNSQTSPQTNLAENANEAPSASNFRQIQTFMKRKTHVGRRAEIGLTAECWHFFIQSPADFDAMNIDKITDLRAEFANPNAPLTLEIGFGMGTSLVEMAKNSPERNFVGIEVHEAGLGNCAFLANESNLTNLKLICGDAIALLKQLPPEHLDTVQLYFPDPWQKKRHYKRRFVTPERMAIVATALKQGGIFHGATDWEHYAFWMVDVLNGMNTFKTLSESNDFIPRPDFRPLTKFEKRGLEAGHGIWDVMYQKV